MIRKPTHINKNLKRRNYENLKNYSGESLADSMLIAMHNVGFLTN